jgi:PAS domain-containing protein
MDQAVDALRRRGEAFSLVLSTTRGHHVEAEGRPIGGAAVLRLREVTGAKLDHARSQNGMRSSQANSRSFASCSTSRRRRSGCAAPTAGWCSPTAPMPMPSKRAIPPTRSRAESSFSTAPRAPRRNATRAEGQPFAKRVPAVVAGQRRVLDVFELGVKKGAAGIGIDASEAERLRSELARTIDAHRRTLDQLATAVAIFGQDERLVFYNDAYRKLFDFEAAFLDERPRDSVILDRLRERASIAGTGGFPRLEGAIA